QPTPVCEYLSILPSQATWQGVQHFSSCWWASTYARRGLAALQEGIPMKQGTAAWHEARAAVPFKASTIGQ
ncbi:hypothetical protein DUNSADRAFT_7335, partial [Dunaliella salina]